MWTTIGRRLHTMLDLSAQDHVCQKLARLLQYLPTTSGDDPGSTEKKRLRKTSVRSLTSTT